MNSIILFVLFLSVVFGKEIQFSTDKKKVFKEIENKVPTIRINMPEDDYKKIVEVAQIDYENIMVDCGGKAALLPDYASKSNVTYELDGEIKNFKKVEVKTGGNWSRTTDRIGFNIKFKGDDRLFNQKHLRLRPDPSDYTAMRSKISMELLYRYNMPTLQSTYVNLYVNDAYFGLYLLQTTIKTDWIIQEYDRPKKEEIKTLFNCKNDGANLDLETIDHCFNANDDYANYTQPLVEAVTYFGNAKSVEELRKILNVDLLMKNMAFEFLIGSYDHFVTNGHNYYMYQKEDGIWDMILNDFDNTFGMNLFVFYVYGMSNELIDITQAPFEKLMKEKKLIQITYFEDNQVLFKKALRELIVTGFNEEFLFNRIEEIKKIITPHMEKTLTPNEDGTYPGAINLKGQPTGHTMKDFDNSFTVTSEDQMQIGLKNWISKRIAFTCETYGFDIDEINKEAAEYAKTGKYVPKIQEEQPKEPKEPTEPEKPEEPKEPKEPKDDECWSVAYGYECCDDCNVIKSDELGDWGSRNGEWCGIKASLCKTGTEGCPKTNYPCCSHCIVDNEDKTARWGIENGDWCTINFSC